MPQNTTPAADRIEELEAKLEALDHAYDSIVQALRFEALRTDDAETKLITCATNAAKYGHQCLELSAQLEAAMGIVDKQAALRTLLAEVFADHGKVDSLAWTDAVAEILAIGAKP